METKTQNQTALENLLTNIKATCPELLDSTMYANITKPTIYLVMWQNVVDGELTIYTNAFWTLDKAREYQTEVIIPRIKKEWDITDSTTEYNMNDEYEEGETVVESGTDYFSVFENGNAVLFREDTYIRPLVLE